MSRFKNKQGKETPKVSTASLPDIVFMLLFFFMVVTVIRQKETLVDITLPQATEIAKLQNSRKTEHIYIGQDRRATTHEAPRVQINDKFIQVDDIHFTIADPAKDDDIIALEVDREVSMGIVTDVKTEIRKANRLKIHYMANQDYEK